MARRTPKPVAHPACSICDGLTHHWVADPPDDMRYTHACKHCPVVGDMCETCHETGLVNGVECPACQAEGVIPCGFEPWEDRDDA